jgi:hypothetical protein
VTHSKPPKAALETCEKTLAEHEHDLQKMQGHAATAADDVIRSEAASRVLKEARVLQEKLIAARVALQFMHSNNLMPEPLMREARTLLGFREFATWSGNVEYHFWNQHAEHQRWAGLHAELTKNADVDVV